MDKVCLDNGAVTLMRNFCPENTQQLAHSKNIDHARDVRNNTFPATQDGRSQYRKGGIFRSADPDFSAQPFPTCDDNSIHRCL